LVGGKEVGFGAGSGNGELARRQGKEETILLIESFANSEHVEEAASRHAKWIAKTGTWSVPEGMFKFMREVYKLNGGTLPIPGEGADFELDKGVWVDSTLIPNHAKLYKAPKVVAPQEVEYDYS
jgi:hypothetical protein